MEDPTSGLIDRCEQLCERRERTDLAQRLGATRARWAATDVRVLVVGEFKQGKSQLVNALLGAPVCPVSDDIATTVPLTVRYAESPWAALLRSPGGSISEDEPVREPVDIARLASLLAAEGPGRRDDAEAPQQDRIVAAEAGLPRQLLRDGLTLVDTPGVGGLDSTHGAATRAVLPSAHAVLVVSDASQELTAPEVDFIRQALAACPHVALVLTKTDLHAEWRRVQELNAARLADARLSLPQLAISSELRLLAGSTKDAGLNADSGFPRLLAFLRRSVVSRREELARQTVRHDLRAVLGALGSSLESERRVLTDPSHLPSVLAELTRAQARAEELKRRSARWQQTLTDGVTDLNADLEHDLRDRIRTVQAEAERAIDEGDPGQAWPEFVSWLEDTTAAALADTFSWAEQNAAWLAARVADHFEEDSATSLPSISISDTSSLRERVREVGDIGSAPLSLGGKVLVGMKGSYGGVLMFGVLTGLAGMALINPISVGAGLLLGGRAYREDSENRLGRRRAEARALVRRHLDEVVFQTSKVLRDRMRQVQRTVRDHFAAVADDLARDIGQSVAGAQKAAKAGQREREQRLAALGNDQNAVARLQREVASVLGDPTPGRAHPPARADRPARPEAAS